MLISLVSASASEAATAAKAPTTTKSGTEDSHPKERRTDLMYAAALELELWKEDQKLLAREKLQHEVRSLVNETLTAPPLSPLPCLELMNCNL